MAGKREKKTESLAGESWAVLQSTASLFRWEYWIRGRDFPKIHTAEGGAEQRLEV